MTQRITSFGQDDGSARLQMLGRSSMSRATSFELSESNPVVRRMLEQRNTRVYGSHRASVPSNGPVYDRFRGDNRVREAQRPQVGRMLHAKVADYKIGNEQHWTVSGANLSGTGFGQRNERYQRDYPLSQGRGQYNFQVSGVGGEVGREVQQFFSDLESGRRVHSGKHLVVSSPGQDRRGSLANRVLNIVNNTRDHSALYITSPTLTDRSLLDSIIAKARRGDQVFVAFGGTHGASDREMQGGAHAELARVAKAQGLPIHLAWGIVPDHTSRISQGDTFTVGSNRFSRSSFTGSEGQEHSTEATLIMQEKRISDAVRQSIKANFAWNKDDMEAMKLLASAQQPAKVSGDLRLGFDGYGFLMPAVVHYRRTGRAGDNIRMLIDTNQAYDNNFRTTYEYIHANNPQKMRLREEASAKIFGHIYSEIVFAANRSVIGPQDLPESIRQLDRGVMSNTVYETGAAISANGLRMLNLRPAAEVLNAAIGSKFTGALPEDFIARITAQYGNRGVVGSIVVGFGAWLDDLTWKNTLGKQEAGYQLRYDQQDIHRSESWTNLMRGTVDTAFGIGLMGAAMGTLNTIAKIGSFAADAVDMAAHRAHYNLQGTALGIIGKAGLAINNGIQASLVGALKIGDGMQGAIYAEIQGLLHGQGAADQFRRTMSWAHSQSVNVLHHDTDYTADGLIHALQRTHTSHDAAGNVVSTARPMEKGTYRVMTHQGQGGQTQFRLVAMDQIDPNGQEIEMAPDANGQRRYKTMHDVTHQMRGLAPGSYVPASVGGRGELQGSFFSLLYRRIPVFSAYYDAVSHFPWAEGAKEWKLRAGVQMDNARVLGLQVSRVVHKGLIGMAAEAASTMAKGRISSWIARMGAQAVARGAWHHQDERYTQHISNIQSRQEQARTAVSSARANAHSGAETQFSHGRGMRGLRPVIGMLMFGAAADYLAGQVGTMKVGESGLRTQLDALRAMQAGGGGAGGHSVTPEDFLGASRFSASEMLPMWAVGLAGKAVRAMNNLAGRDGQYLTSVPYTMQHDATLPILNFHADASRLAAAFSSDGLTGRGRVYNVVSAMGAAGMDMVTATMNNVMVSMKMAHDGEIARSMTEREMVAMSMSENARRSDALGETVDPKISEAVHELSRYAREYAGMNNGSTVQIRSVTGIRIGSLMGAAAGGYFMTSGNKTNLLLTVMLPMPLSGGIGIKLPFYFQAQRGRNMMQNVDEGRTSADPWEQGLIGSVLGSQTGKAFASSMLNPLNYGIEYGSDAEVLMRGQMYAIGTASAMVMSGPAGGIGAVAAIGTMYGVGSYYGSKNAGLAKANYQLSVHAESGALGNVIVPPNGGAPISPIQTDYDPRTGAPIHKITFANGTTEVLHGGKRLGAVAGLVDFVRTGNRASLAVGQSLSVFGAMANVFEHAGQQSSGLIGGATKVLGASARTGHFLTHRMVPFANPVFAAGRIGIAVTFGAAKVGVHAWQIGAHMSRRIAGRATSHDPQVRWDFDRSRVGQAHRAAVMGMYGVHKVMMIAGGLVLGKAIYEASQSNRLDQLHLMSGRRFDEFESWMATYGATGKWAGGLLSNVGRNISDLRGTELVSRTDRRSEVLSGFESLQAREGAVSRGATRDTAPSILSRQLEVFWSAVKASFTGITRGSQLPEVATASGSNFNVQMNQIDPDTIGISKIVNRFGAGPFTIHSNISAQISGPDTKSNDPMSKVMLARQAGTDDVRFANAVKSGRTRAALMGTMFARGSGASRLSGTLKMALNIRYGESRDMMGMTGSEILSYYGFNKGGGMLKNPAFYKLMRSSAEVLNNDGIRLKGGISGLGVAEDDMQIRDSEYVKNLVRTLGTEAASAKLYELSTQAGGRFQSVRDQLGIHAVDGTGLVMRSSFSGEVEDETSQFTAGPGQGIDDPLKPFRTNSLSSSLFNYPGGGGAGGYGQLAQISTLMVGFGAPLVVAGGLFALSMVGTLLSDGHTRLERRTRRVLAQAGRGKLVYMSDAPRALGGARMGNGVTLADKVDILGGTFSHTRVQGIAEPQGTVAALGLRDPNTGEFIYFGGRQGLAFGEERGVGKAMGVSGSSEKALSFLSKHDSFVDIFGRLGQSKSKHLVLGILDELDSEANDILTMMRVRGGYAIAPTRTQAFIDDLTSIRGRLNAGPSLVQRVMHFMSFGKLGRNAALDALLDIESTMLSHVIGSNFGSTMGLEQIRGAETLRQIDGQVEAAPFKAQAKALQAELSGLRAEEARLAGLTNPSSLDRMALLHLRYNISRKEKMVTWATNQVQVNRVGRGAWTLARDAVNRLGYQMSNSARGSNVGSARGGREHIAGSAYGSSANMGHASVGTSVSRFQTLKHVIGDTGAPKVAGGVLGGLIMGFQAAGGFHKLAYGSAIAAVPESVYPMTQQERNLVMRASASAGANMGWMAAEWAVAGAAGLAATAFFGMTAGGLLAAGIGFGLMGLGMYYNDDLDYATQAAKREANGPISRMGSMTNRMGDFTRQQMESGTLNSVAKLMGSDRLNHYLRSADQMAIHLSSMLSGWAQAEENTIKRTSPYGDGTSWWSSTIRTAQQLLPSMISPVMQTKNELLSTQQNMSWSIANPFWMNRSPVVWMNSTYRSPYGAGMFDWFKSYYRPQMERLRVSLDFGSVSSEFVNDETLMGVVGGNPDMMQQQQSLYSRFQQKPRSGSFASALSEAAAFRFQQVGLPGEIIHREIKRRGILTETGILGALFHRDNVDTTGLGSHVMRGAWGRGARPRTDGRRPDFAGGWALAKPQDFRNAVDAVMSSTTSGSITGRISANLATSLDRLMPKVQAHLNYVRSHHFNVAGLDAHLIASMIAQESGGDRTAVSPVGARGYMQVMPETFNEIRREMGLPNMRIDNADDNLRAGIYYIGKQLQAFNGNVAYALAAYNGGAGAVSYYGGVPPMSFAKGETTMYVNAIMNGWMPRIQVKPGFETVEARQERSLRDGMQAYIKANGSMGNLSAVMRQIGSSIGLSDDKADQYTSNLRSYFAQNRLLIAGDLLNNSMISQLTGTKADPYDETKPADKGVYRREMAQAALSALGYSVHFTPNELVHALVSWKGAYISSGLGHRESPGGIGSRNHAGMDIAAPAGDSVRMPGYAGKVISAGWGGGYGNLVQVSVAGGYTFKFGHLSRISVQGGAQINAGTLIGNVGSTGNSTGPHLHFEIRSPQGAVVNPVAFFGASQVLGSSRYTATQIREAEQAMTGALDRYGGDPLLAAYEAFGSKGYKAIAPLALELTRLGSTIRHKTNGVELDEFGLLHAGGSSGVSEAEAMQKAQNAATESFRRASTYTALQGAQDASVVPGRDVVRDGAPGWAGMLGSLGGLGLMNEARLETALNVKSKQISPFSSRMALQMSGRVPAFWGLAGVSAIAMGAGELSDHGMPTSLNDLGSRMINEDPHQSIGTMATVGGATAGFGYSILALNSAFKAQTFASARHTHGTFVNPGAITEEMLAARTASMQQAVHTNRVVGWGLSAVRNVARAGGALAMSAGAIYHGMGSLKYWGDGTDKGRRRAAIHHEGLAESLGNIAGGLAGGALAVAGVGALAAAAAVTAPVWVTAAAAVGGAMLLGGLTGWAARSWYRGGSRRMNSPEQERIQGRAGAARGPMARPWGADEEVGSYVRQLREARTAQQRQGIMSVIQGRATAAPARFGLLMYKDAMQQRQALLHQVLRAALRQEAKANQPRPRPRADAGATTTVRVDTRMAPAPRQDVHASNTPTPLVRIAGGQASVVPKPVTPRARVTAHATPFGVLRTDANPQPRVARGRI